MKYVMKYIAFFGSVIAVAGAEILLISSCNGITNHYVCTKSSKVKTILSLHYRDADIQLENGDVVNVYQATLKPGDDYCEAGEWK